MTPGIIGLALVATVVLILLAGAAFLTWLDWRDDKHDKATARRIAVAVEDETPDEVLVPSYRPHAECVNNWADGKFHRVHARCRAAIVSARGW